MLAGDPRGSRRARRPLGFDGRRDVSARDAIERRVGRMLRHRRAGRERSVVAVPGLEPPASAAPLGVTSPAFEHGGDIPVRHSGAGRGDNVSPALAFSPLPAGTRQLLVVMEDPDVPLRAPVVHMAALLPPVATVESGALAADSSLGRFLPGSFGRTGYQGPRPLAGHGPHSYLFHVYALDVVPGGTTLEAVIAEASGHVLTRGLLEGVQEH